MNSRKKKNSKKNSSNPPRKIRDIYVLKVKKKSYCNIETVDKDLIDEKKMKTKNGGFPVELISRAQLSKRKFYKKYHEVCWDKNNHKYIKITKENQDLKTIHPVFWIAGHYLNSFETSKGESPKPIHKDKTRVKKQKEAEEYNRQIEEKTQTGFFKNNQKNPKRENTRKNKFIKKDNYKKNTDEKLQNENSSDECTPKRKNINEKSSSSSEENSEHNDGDYSSTESSSGHKKNSTPDKRLFRFNFSTKIKKNINRKSSSSSEESSEHNDDDYSNTESSSGSTPKKNLFIFNFSTKISQESLNKEMKTETKNNNHVDYLENNKKIQNSSLKEEKENIDNPITTKNNGYSKTETPEKNSKKRALPKENIQDIKRRRLNEELVTIDDPLLYEYLGLFYRPSVTPKELVSNLDNSKEKLTRQKNECGDVTTNNFMNLLDLTFDL